MGHIKTTPGLDAEVKNIMCNAKADIFGVTYQKVSSCAKYLNHNYSPKL